MVDRIKQVMEYYEETPATFAEKLGVNRSNLTHLFSGRNQPSLEFAKKVLSAYPEVRTEWLIMGVGEMIKDPDQEVVPPKKTFIQKDLFEMDDDLEVEENEISDESESVQEGTPSLQNEIKPNVEDTQKQSTIVKQAETKLEDENVKTAPTVSQTTIAAETQSKIVAEKMVEKTVQHVENKQNNSAITPAASARCTSAATATCGSITATSRRTMRRSTPRRPQQRWSSM